MPNKDLNNPPLDCSSECVLCKMQALCDEPWDMPILTTNSFFVIAGKGQLCKGYLIICSKAHLENMSFLSDDQWSELMELKEFLDAVCLKLFGNNPWYFEHGGIREEQGGNCINHAHMHLITKPLNSIPKYLMKDKTPIIQIQSREHLESLSPYFYFEFLHKKYVAQIESIPCQLGRKIIVDHYELNENWDWRVATDTLNMIKCRELYLDFFRTELKTGIVRSNTSDFVLNIYEEDW